MGGTQGRAAGVSGRGWPVPFDAAPTFFAVDYPMASTSPNLHAELAMTPREGGDNQGRGLLSHSFLGLLLTQFFGATNDNLLRWLVIGVGKQYVEESQVGWILATGTMAFVLPYLLLAAPSGYLADAMSKRSVIVGCKLAEIAIMILAVLSIVYGSDESDTLRLLSVTMMLLIVALMGAQSALFGPSKLGSIPEMLDETKISAANGLIGLTTVVATTVGAGAGMWLADATGVRGQERWWLSAAVLVSIAIVGLITSLAIEHLPVANSKRKFPWDMARQTVRDLRTLASQRAMLRVALGIMFFWSLGALFQLSIDQYAFEGGATEQSQVTPLLIALVIGVGLGSVVAGIWSGGRVELGILPLGAGGLAIGSLLLFAVEGHTDQLQPALDGQLRQRLPAVVSDGLFGRFVRRTAGRLHAASQRSPGSEVRSWRPVIS